MGQRLTNFLKILLKKVFEKRFLNYYLIHYILQKQFFLLPNK